MPLAFYGLIGIMLLASDVEGVDFGCARTLVPGIVKKA